MNLPQALIPVCLAASASASAAALTPDAVRLTVGAQTCVVRTLGRPTDADFSAPTSKPPTSISVSTAMP